MKMNCPNCQEPITVPMPEREERRILPWIILGAAALVGLALFGLLILAALSLPTVGISERAVQAERAAMEVARAEADMQRQLAELQAAKARAAAELSLDEKGNSGSKPLSRQTVEDVIKIYRDLDADPAKRQLGNDEKLDLVLETLKKPRESNKRDEPPARP